MKMGPILLLAALATAGSIADAKAARPRSYDRTPTVSQYVPLARWARANEFQIRTLDRGRALQLSNRLASVVFNLDPHQDLRKAEVNGIQVWLAFPLVVQPGGVSISQVDLSTTLAPILSPPSNPPGIQIKSICLDPGHGGTDPGEMAGGVVEKKYTLLLAQEVRDQLTARGLKTSMIRNSDTTVKIQNRPGLVRQSKADLLVSIHFNSSPVDRNEVKGVEVYCCTPAGAASRNAGGEVDMRWFIGNRNDDRNMALAYQVQKSLVRSLSPEDRGVKRARYLVLREATMPAILIEGGFLSHPAESKKITDPAYRRQMARAIADGIMAYKRLVKG